MDSAGGPVELPGGVFVDGATALELASAMRLVVAEARRRGVSLSPRLAAAARSFEAVGERWAKEARATYRDPNVPIPTEGTSVKVAVMGTVGTREAAEMLGITPRAVIALAHRGTLRGQRVGWAWAFDLADVTDLVNKRKDRHAA